MDGKYGRPVTPSKVFALAHTYECWYTLPHVFAILIAGLNFMFPAGIRWLSRRQRLQFLVWLFYVLYCRSAFVSYFTLFVS